jgi:hypothetical protein
LNTLSWKLVPLLGLLAICAAVGRWAVPAAAAPTGITVNGGAGPASVNVGSSATIIVNYQDEGAPAILTVTSTASPTVGFFYGGSVTTNSDSQVIAYPNSGSQVTVGDDVDGNVEATALTVNFWCLSPGTADISGAEGGTTSSTVTINCVTAANPTLAISATSQTVGSTVTVSGTCTSANQQIVGTGSFGTFAATGTNTTASGATATCTAATGFSIVFTCSSVGTESFALGAATPVTVACGSTGTALTVSPATNYVGGQLTVTGTCTAAGQTLSASVTGFALSPAPTGGTWTSGSTILCSGAGPVTAYYSCGYAVSVTFVLTNPTNDAGYLNCGSYNTGYPYGTTYPYVNPVVNQPGPATNLTVSANPQSLSCNTTSTLSVTVRDASGNTVANGTSVMLTTTSGNVTPTQATTSNGSATVTFLAPSSSGNVTITAAAGTALNSTNLNVTCNAPSTSTVSTVPVLPPSIPAAPVTAPRSTGVINPPNTGDAGLASLSDLSTAVTDAFAW